MAVALNYLNGGSDVNYRITHDPFIKNSEGLAFEGQEFKKNSILKVRGSERKPFSYNASFVVLISIGSDVDVASSLKRSVDNYNVIRKFNSMPTLIESFGTLSKSEVKDDETKIKARHVLAMTEFMEESNEREASRFLMSEIEGQLRIKQLELINNLLLIINRYNLSPRAQVCLLRATYRAKSFLPSWKLAFSYTRENLESLGENSKAWLVGLSDARN